MKTMKCKLVKDPILDFRKICGTFMDILKPDFIEKKCGKESWATNCNGSIRYRI
jgi:hypothetical protein